MRMWMIDPSLLCRKHLLGAHSEIHKHKHVFEKKYSIDGRISPVVQIEPNSMQEEHDRLAQEMVARGYSHKSPFVQPDLSYLREKASVRVDREHSIVDLSSRCSECKKRIAP
jgi:hypothetical protein